MRTLTLLLLFLPSLAFAQEGAPELRYYYPVPAANPPKTVEADV